MFTFEFIRDAVWVAIVTPSHEQLGVLTQLSSISGSELTVMLPVRGARFRPNDRVTMRAATPRGLFTFDAVVARIEDAELVVRSPHEPTSILHDQRRRYDRAALTLPCTFRFFGPTGDVTWHATTRDLSGGGVRIAVHSPEVVHPFPVNTSGDFELTIAPATPLAPAHRIRCGARAVRVSPNPSMELAFEFFNLLESDRFEIIKLVLRAQHERTTKR